MSMKTERTYLAIASTDTTTFREWASINGMRTVGRPMGIDSRASVYELEETSSWVVFGSDNEVLYNGIVIGRWVLEPVDRNALEKGMNRVIIPEKARLNLAKLREARLEREHQNAENFRRYKEEARSA